jgi:hypothetical protein
MNPQLKREKEQRDLLVFNSREKKNGTINRSSRGKRVEWYGKLSVISYLDSC